MTAGRLPVRRPEPTTAVEFAQEQQAVDLLERPVGLPDGDAAHERRQVGGLSRSQAPLEQQAEGRTGDQRGAPTVGRMGRVRSAPGSASGPW